MKKRLISLVLAILMLCASAAAAEGTAHTHEESEAWDRDLAQHWHICECGEKLGEAEDHVMDDIMCTVCGSEIWDFGEGSGCIVDYNEMGDTVRYTAYEEAAVYEDYRYVIVYGEDGNKISAETYCNDFLCEVIEYGVGADGCDLPSAQYFYSDDGTSGLNQYDEYGNLVYSASYDEEGAVIVEETAEYVYDEDGWVLEARNVLQFSSGEKFVDVKNEYGDTMMSAIYEANGELASGSRYEYEYDENGNKLWARQYSELDGRLVRESEYALIEDEWGTECYEKITIDYEEDGGKYVCEWNNRGNELSAVQYDAEGEIVTAYRSEYEYDENGNVMLMKRYENDRLYLIEEYADYEDEDVSCYYQKSYTEIYESGDRYIIEYDMDGNEISAGLFDQNGNLIPEDGGADEE